MKKCNVNFTLHFFTNYLKGIIKISQIKKIEEKNLQMKKNLVI